LKPPTDEQIEIARLWLESNEGEGEEHAACIAVANWLLHYAYERMLRQEARRAGITVGRLRRQLLADKCGT
jgi:hypothetical protein